MCVCVCACVMSDCDPKDCSPPGSSVHGIFQARNTGADCHFLLQGNLPDPGIESNPCLLHLLRCQAGSLPLAPAGKPMCNLRTF